MTFEYPFVLSAFFIIVVIFLLDISASSKKYRQKLPNELKNKLRLSSALFKIFLALGIIALSGPRWGTDYTVSEYSRGLDVILAIDVSRSMDVTDTPFSVTRLEQGLSIVKESMKNIAGVRFAAVIGRSRGYLAVPLSYDSEAVFNFLESLDVSSITGRSTNLESLVETASLSFQNNSAAKKVIVLISDGESHSGLPRNAFNYCAENEIMIIAVAAGSNEGSFVPFMQEEAISRRDAAVMRMAAERTGGVYIDANRSDSSRVLTASLLSITQEKRAESRQTHPKQRRTLFTILALLAYCAYKFIPRLLSGLNKKTSFVSIIALVLLLSSCTKGKILLLEANYLASRSKYDEAVIPYLEALQYEDASPYAEYGLGLAFYSLDENTAALKRYENSLKKLETLSENEHSELRYRIHYNSGIIHFEEGDFTAAAYEFREALKADPEKLGAKINLELSLLSIKLESGEGNGNETRNEKKEILFDYIREHEQNYWKSGEWTEEEKFPGPDY